MLEFIRLLKQRYQHIVRIHSGDGSQATDYQQRIETLTLAEAFIRKGSLIATLPSHPLQIAILGPTQSGKSSVTNLLLGDKAAGVSPLAGFTVHPQGFCYSVKEQHYAWLNQYFVDYQQVNQKNLIRSQYECYSLNALSSNPSSPLPTSILWDTPDFDSIDAAGYREGVLRTVALADIILLVVSKEKYADQSVWDMMSLLAPLNQPCIIVVNKLVENAKDLILKSLQEKWRQARNDPFPEVVALYYQSDGGLTAWPKGEHQRMNRLLQAAHKKSDRRKHEGYQRQLLLSHWQSWVAPVKAEHAMQEEWQNLLDKSINKALDNYQRDYLNHPHNYHTFQNAIAELLTLLEIPGLAALLANTRKILTWPVKKLLRLGRVAGTKIQGGAENSQEVTLLNQISEHLLISLADNVLDKIDQQPEGNQWWKEINSLLRKQRSAVLHSYQNAVKSYHSEFQTEIEATAHRLYHKLQGQPITLNSLRATRVTTDAAAVALALKTGGIGLHDLIITPAMLSVTSLLTESALGSYMGLVEAELKRKQLETVKRKLLNGSLRSSLSLLPDLMDKQTRFNISEERIQELEQSMKEKRHGLQLF